MTVLTRRIFLKMTGLLAFATAWPGVTHSGLLDRFFRSTHASRTVPITPNDEFYVTSYRSPPTICLNEWSLAINGLVERPMTLTYDELLARPTVSQIVTLECVGNTVAGEFIGTAEWEGVSLRALLEEAGVSATAYDVVFRAADGYSDGIRLDRALAGDVLIAHRMNGVPLPLGHGFPARLIVPGHYGMKSVQWLSAIDVVAEHYKGYYAQKGWTDEAIVKTMSRIDLPDHGTTITGFRQTVEGFAFAGVRGIQQVEISTDGGERWELAALDVPLAPAAWRFWRYEWVVRQSGRYTLLVRATDGTGRLQTSIEQEPAPDGAAGLHEITVTVLA
jgi:DMSO/TMAO reductase YedYZ molybdopterin-dependent catalytic subunit